MTQSEFSRAVDRLCEELDVRLVGPIGSGAFKRVYEVHDSSRGRLALKVIVAESENPRNERETAVLRECEHANIVSLIDFGTVDVGSRPMSYVLEELLDGGTLSSRTQKTLLSSTEVKQIALGISAALLYLEKMDIVHRDIKPDNIMFRAKSSEPILVDFGLVRILDDVSLTETWAMRGPGTPYYAPSEQLRNDKALIDWRSDQFSLGVTLSVAALGVHPYQHTGEPDFDHAAVERVINRESVSPQFEELAKSKGLEPLVTMVQPFPIDRFNSPNALISAWENTRG